MFDHVGLRMIDYEASRVFYETVLSALGVPVTSVGEGITEWDDFAISPAEAERPPTRGLHIGFAAGSRAAVDAFWRAGVDAGHASDGAPGPRPQYREDYYGGFLLDPDGNSVEAVHHGAMNPRGNVDHLWIRVSDLAAARAFHLLVGEHAGYAVGGADDDERVHFRGRGSSFSLVPGPPTAHLHVAFSAPDRATVQRFHRALVGAGYADNGGPGERPEYHPGYYGAFVRDPDGTNVELVVHDR